MTSWLDHTVNGLVIGNIYALLAVGLALIYGVSRLVNFAHGSVYVVGAYTGFVAVNHLGTPLVVTILLVAAVTALLGMPLERFAIRPLADAPRIAPLLSTIGASFVIDQLVQLTFTPDPRALQSALPDWRITIGGGTIGPLDLLIAAIGLTSAALLFGFLRFTSLGWAVRATAQDREAAQQMGVDVDAVNRTVFAIASALGGVSGVLVGVYYNYIDPAMSFQATLKGIVAEVVGGVGNVPGAIAGSLILGLVESYGIALLGTSYRNLFAFLLLMVILVLRPNGLFTPNRRLPPEPLTDTFIAPSRPITLPPALITGAAVLAFVLPLAISAPYLLQTLTNAWLYALLGLSLTLVAGTVGLISLGHAAFLAIGGYTSALLALDLGVSVAAAILLAGLITAALGTLLVSPAFRSRLGLSDACMEVATLRGRRPAPENRRCRKSRWGGRRRRGLTAIQQLRRWRWRIRPCRRQADRRLCEAVFSANWPATGRRQHQVEITHLEQLDLALGQPATASPALAATSPRSANCSTSSALGTGGIALGGRT